MSSTPHFLRQCWKFFIAAFLVFVSALLLSVIVLLVLIALTIKFPFGQENAKPLYAGAVLVLTVAYCIRKIVILFRKPAAQTLPVRPNRVPRIAKTFFIILLAASVIFCLCDTVPLVGYVATVALFRSYPGLFRRARMERIVEQVRKQSFTGHVDFLLDAAGNIEPRDNLNNIPDVFARRDKDGALSVEILLLNYGHAGLFGYAYSDKSPAKDDHPDGEETGWLRLSVPGPMQAAYPGYRIDDHWWKVWDDED